MPKLTPGQSGMMVRTVSERFACHHSTAIKSKTLQIIQVTGSTIDSAFRDQRRVATSRQDRNSVRRVIRDRTLPAFISAATVCGQ